MNPGERWVALALLAFSILYGVVAHDIAIFPGRENELISSRTLPYALSIVGALCSLWLLLMPEAIDESTDDAEFLFFRLAWGQCFALMGIMLFYAVTITGLGFILSTMIFLMAGSLLLGERRIHVVAMASLIPIIGFWLILELALGMQLPRMTYF